jgi:hypothetical protein
VILPLVLALSAAAAPAGRTFTVDPAASRLTYDLVHKLHEVKGTTKQLEGKAVLQPDGRVLAMLRAPVGSFDSGDANRDAHMQETMHTGRHPFVVVRGIAALDVAAASAGAPIPLTLTAEVDLHGVKSTQEVAVKLAFAQDGTARATGVLTVSLEKHQVERPSLLFVKVDDAVKVEFDVLFREVKP